MAMEDLKQKYTELYDYMAKSKQTEHMKAFGIVMTEMFDWFIHNKKDAAEKWLMKLEGIRWDNYLTPQEAENIIDKMHPKAPWSRDVWKNAMEEHGLTKENKPCYNQYALWTTMNMLMSDSYETIAKYVDKSKMFRMVHDLAVDKLTDKDKMFNIRKYFNT